MNMSDPSGYWPESVNTAMKIFAGIAIVATTALVITGTGGAAAVIALGVTCSAATGGYFNEKAGGNFTSGYIGGAVSGLVQGIAGYGGGPVGVTLGGSAGSGLGTFVTEVIDNYWVPIEKKKSMNQILNDSKRSAAAALVTSSLSGYLGNAIDVAVPTQANGLMPALTKTFGNMLNTFFSALDDALTYIALM